MLRTSSKVRGTLEKLALRVVFRVEVLADVVVGMAQRRGPTCDQPLEHLGNRRCLHLGLPAPVVVDLHGVSPPLVGL